MLLLSCTQQGVLAQGGKGLTSYEAEIVARSGPDVSIYPRSDIILVWANAWKPRWYPESGVNNPGQLADLLERAYGLLAQWTNYDPNAAFQRQYGDRERLVIYWNPSLGDGALAEHMTETVSTNNGDVYEQRSYIQIKDFTGSENDFGILCHEMSHDFFHHHPNFDQDNPVWGEGLADYCRYQLLNALGMHRAAARWRLILYAHPEQPDRYKTPAGMLLNCQVKNHLDSPLDLFRFLSDKDFNTAVGTPKWDGNAPQIILPPAAPSHLTINHPQCVVFSDDFHNPASSRINWIINQNGGSVQFNQGAMALKDDPPGFDSSLANNGKFYDHSGFPCTFMNHNPFPKAGDWTLCFTLSYNKSGPPNPDGLYVFYPDGSTLLAVFQDDMGEWAELDGVPTFRADNNSGSHTFELEKSNSQVSLTVDGTPISSTPIGMAPSTVEVGGSLIHDSRQWNNFDLQSITVSVPAISLPLKYSLPASAHMPHRPATIRPAPRRWKPPVR